MAFLTLEDLTGSVEVVVFPRVYEQQGFALKRDAVVLLRGKVDIQEQDAKFLCEEVLQLPSSPDPVASDGDAQDEGSAAPGHAGNGNGAADDPARPSLRIRVTTREEIDQLERYLLDHPGDRQVCVHVVTDGGEEHIVPARVRLRDADGLHQELEQMFGEGNVWEE